MILLEEAKKLKRGTILYSNVEQNSDGTPASWRVNGKPITWRRAPERVIVPIRRGLYEFGYLTEDNLDLFDLCVN